MERKDQAACGDDPRLLGLRPFGLELPQASAELGLKMEISRGGRGVNRDFGKLRGSVRLHFWREPSPRWLHSSTWNLAVAAGPCGRSVASDSVYQLSQLDVDGLRICLWNSETGAREGEAPAGGAEEDSTLRPSRESRSSAGHRVGSSRSLWGRPPRSGTCCPRVWVCSLPACASGRTAGCSEHLPARPQAPSSLRPTADPVTPHVGGISAPRLLSRL